MSVWLEWQDLSGHRFHEAIGPDAFCARCGVTVADWRHDLPGLMRTRCPGPRREAWWPRLLRWLLL